MVGWGEGLTVKQSFYSLHFTADIMSWLAAGRSELQYIPQSLVTTANLGYRLPLAGGNWTDQPLVEGETHEEGQWDTWTSQVLALSLANITERETFRLGFFSRNNHYLHWCSPQVEQSLLLWPIIVYFVRKQHNKIVLNLTILSKSRIIVLLTQLISSRKSADRE